MFPKLFDLGGFFLPSYGLLVAAGFLAGLTLASSLARRKNLDADLIANLAIYCALAGLLGAKLLMFAFDFEYYARHPDRLISLDTLLSAGIFHGGLLAAIGFAWYFVRRHRLPWLATADVLAPAAAVGHAIGRLGCFAAGCCWGARCDRPWAVTFTSKDAHELVGVPLGVPLHPTQLYEAAGTGLVALLLWRASLRPQPAGRVLALYLILYSAVRLLTESFREHQQETPFGLPLTWTQWISLALALAGIWLFRRVSGTRAGQVPG